MQQADNTGCICIWGDSIAWGASDIEKGGWVNRLWLDFMGSENANNISVYNLGIAGENTTGLVKRFNGECETRSPEVIIFAIGINDSLYINNKNNCAVPISKFRENLENIYITALQYTNKIGFIGLTKVDESKTMPATWDKTNYYDNENVRTFDDELCKFALKNNIAYLRIYDLLEIFDLDDGLHPNSKGHEKMYEEIKKFILEKLL